MTLKGKDTENVCVCVNIYRYMCIFNCLIVRIDMFMSAYALMHKHTVELYSAAIDIHTYAYKNIVKYSSFFTDIT